MGVVQLIRIRAAIKSAFLWIVPLVLYVDGSFISTDAKSIGKRLGTGLFF